MFGQPFSTYLLPSNIKEDSFEGFCYIAGHYIFKVLEIEVFKVKRY